MADGRNTSLAANIVVAAPPRPDGYRPLAEAAWVWGGTVQPPELDEWVYILTAARRLDTAHELFESVRTDLGSYTRQSPAGRRTMYSLIGRAELAVVALHKAFRMTKALGVELEVQREFPPELEAKEGALKELRDAYEHIDERVRGRIKQREDPEVFTVLNFDTLLEQRRLTYKGFSLGIDEEVTALAIGLRNHLRDGLLELGARARAKRQGQQEPPR